MVTQGSCAGTGILKKMQSKLVKTRNPPPKGWYKWNSDAPRIEDRNLLQLVFCAEMTEQIHYKKERKIGNCLILLIEALAIREAVRTAIQGNLSSILLKMILILLFTLSWELFRLRALSQILLRILCLLLR